jgi:hypothetical protein
MSKATFSGRYLGRDATQENGLRIKRHLVILKSAVRPDIHFEFYSRCPAPRSSETDRRRFKLWRVSELCGELRR